MKKTILFTLVSVISASSFASGLNLKKNDDCYAAVVALAQGIAQSYKVYDKKPAKIESLDLVSATDTREYSLDVSHDGSVDSYTIELENDSGYKCLMNKIAPTEIGG